MLLLLHALAIGMGPGTRVCVDATCPVALAAADEACCGGACDGEVPAALAEDGDCGCTWLPLSRGDASGLAISVVTPEPIATRAPIALRLPASPVRTMMRCPGPRSSPHLSPLRSIVLTC